MPPKRYFIAASGRDVVWTRAFTHELRTLGFDVWADFDSLSPGENWIDALRAEASSRDFIFIITPDAMRSQWVQLEINVALQAGRNLIPVVHTATDVGGVLGKRQLINVVNVSPQAAARLVSGTLEQADPAPVIARVTGVRVFLSHASEDTTFTKRLERDLSASSASVWVDYNDIPHGDFLRRINDGLSQCNWLVLVVSPAALNPDKDVIRQEVFTALGMIRTKEMHGVIPLVAEPFDIRDMPPLWRNLERYDAAQDYTAALNGLLRAFSLA